MPDADRPDRSSAVARVATWENTLVLLVVAFLVVASVSVEFFGTSRNAGFLVLELVPVLVLAMSATLVIVTGQIDLSIASVVGLTGAFMGVLWNAGLPLETIVPLAVGLGAVLGAVNGVLVAALGLPSLAVTIGTLALYRGLAFVLLGDTAVADWPRSFTGWVIGTLPGTAVPNVVLPVMVLVAATAVLLHATPVGRAIVAIGANATAAHFAGVRVRLVTFWLFVLSGATAGLVGVFWTLRFSSARGDNAVGLELTVVAAVLLGGVSIFGGRGTVPGVVAGVVLLVSLQNALRLANVSTESLTVVTGLLLILSVLLPNVLRQARAALATAGRPPDRTPPAPGPAQPAPEAATPGPGPAPSSPASTPTNRT